MLSRVLFLLFCGVGLICADDLSDILHSFDTETLWTSSAYAGGSKCAQDMNTTLYAVFQRDRYALQMLDASAKIPEALLLGNMIFLGQYDECLSVLSPDGEISGKYCLLGLTIPSNDSDGGGALDNGIGSVNYQYAICVASSCSADDLNQGFNKLNLSNVLHAVDQTCIGANDERTLDTGAWVTISIILVLVALAAISTTYDVWQRFHLGNEKPHELLTAFSVYRGGKTLFEVKDQSGMMGCLNGIRTLSMFWVVFCHNATLGLAGASYNGLELFGDLTSSKYLLATNGYLSVDTFFFLSGLLVSFVFFRDIGRSGTYDVPRSFLTRYLRLTPPYAMVILVHMTLEKYFGNGPMWFGLVTFDKANCESYWWTGLLYVENLVNPKEICLIQTWYLSADMQMYWLAPIFLYALYLLPKLGLIFVGFMTVASAFWTFGIAYAYTLPYTPFFDTTGDEDRMDNFPFWSRMAVWLVGLLLGALICSLKGRKIEVKLNPWTVVCGWLISLALCAACFFGMIWFLENPSTVAENAAFVSFHRVGWALGLAWIVFACINGYGGPINGFLSWGIFQPLGKLSYCAYLVHVSVMFVIFGNQRVSTYSSLFTLSLSFIYILVIANLVAIPLSLLVEMPTMALDRYFLRSIKIFPYPKPKKTKMEEKKQEVVDSAGA